MSKSKNSKKINKPQPQQKQQSQEVVAATEVEKKSAEIKTKSNVNEEYSLRFETLAEFKRKVDYKARENNARRNAECKKIFGRKKAFDSKKFYKSREGLSRFCGGVFAFVALGGLAFLFQVESIMTVTTADYVTMLLMYFFAVISVLMLLHKLLNGKNYTDSESVVSVLEANGYAFEGLISKNPKKVLLLRNRLYESKSKKSTNSVIIGVLGIIAILVLVVLKFMDGLDLDGKIWVLKFIESNMNLRILQCTCLVCFVFCMMTITIDQYQVEFDRRLVETLDLILINGDESGELSEDGFLKQDNDDKSVVEGILTLFKS